MAFQLRGDDIVTGCNDLIMEYRERVPQVLCELRPDNGDVVRVCTNLVAQRIGNLENLLRASVTPKFQVQGRHSRPASSMASPKDSTSSGTIRSSSMCFAPVITTIHRLRVDSLKTDGLCLRERSSVSREKSSNFAPIAHTRSYPAWTRLCAS